MFTASCKIAVLRYRAVFWSETYWCNQK